MTKIERILKIGNMIVDTLIGLLILYFVAKIVLYPPSLSEWMYDVFLSHIDKLN